MTDQPNIPDESNPEETGSQNDELKNLAEGENLTPEELEMIKMMSEMDAGAGQAQTASTGAAAVAESTVETMEFETLKPSPSPEKRDKRMELLLDIMLPVSIELGRTSMLVKDILDLERGSLVEFDKLASEPVDILINGKKMAEGEVVVIDKHFGIRLTNIIDPADRIRGSKK